MTDHMTDQRIIEIMAEGGRFEYIEYSADCLLFWDLDEQQTLEVGRSWTDEKLREFLREYITKSKY